MNVANLYVIADLDNMQVVGNVDEADIGRVKVGQAVNFTVDAYPDEVFRGEVTQVRLNPTTESNVVTYEVVVGAQNPDHKLIPGLTANLTIYVLREENVLLLPAKAFTFEPKDGQVAPPVDDKDEKVVWIAKGDSISPAIVTTGQSNGIKTEILSGLTEGARVATGYVSAAPGGKPKQGDVSPFAPQPPGRKKK